MDKKEARWNQLDRMPDLHECSELRVLDLSWNSISLLEGWALRGLRRLHDLMLQGNRLQRLSANTFTHVPNLLRLNLDGNQIEHIDAETFVPISKLEDLNVGNNVFGTLPPMGLQHLLYLKAHNNPHLRRFHPPALFPKIQTLVLSYAYHCCEFMALTKKGAGAARDKEEAPTDFVIMPRAPGDLSAWASGTDNWANGTNLWANGTDLWANGTDLWAHMNASGVNEAGLAALLARWQGGGYVVRMGESRRAHVQCLPMPGPFLPCVDLFDWWLLRCGVWCVFLLALIGNGAVVFVQVMSRACMDVPQFLVANLAAADMCMGIYLGILAVIDAGTLGKFHMYAVRWQMSSLCRLAGFLGVLSSEMSVFTLVVITLERNYVIMHSMHLNERLSLRHAAYVMGAGWVLALTLAALPLLGVSDYRKFAVCLPFETGSAGAQAYVVALLIANGLALLVLLACYINMLCTIRGSQAWNSNDLRITRRMALLVFTDFLCWSPIIFFALTTVAGVRLVTLEQAKVFTVFVLPLNSCCNPFLYAILTDQFKKDCALVSRAFEESRGTHTIDSCWHPENFSGDETPNTNSLKKSSSGRAGSVSPSMEFSSSCPDLWPAHRRDTASPRRLPASWLVAHKSSQDSNLSSSRIDLSGSNVTPSFWQMW